MAVRIVQNNFVSGELSPDLWGRHDLKAYFQGAAEIRNFIPRRTGGLRKRQGSNVIYELNAITNQVANRFVAFPYLFDSTSGGIVYLYAAGTATVKTIYAGFISVAGSTIAYVTPADVGISTSLAIRYESELNSVRCKQVGDTLFFTRNRKAAFKCAVTYSASNPSATTLAFSMMSQSSVPPTPEELTVVAKNFKYRDKAGLDAAGKQIWDTYPYQSSTRKYSLYGVKDGIFSSAKIVTQGMYMPWSAGAYIELSFNPRWDLHDYYVLAKLNGSQYGIIGEFYPDAGAGDTPDIDFVSASPGGTGPTKTFRASLTSGDVTYLTAPYESDTGPTGVDAKLKSDPNRMVADVVDVALSEYASIYLATEYTIDDEDIHGVILPQHYFAGGFAGGTARICLGGTVRNSNGQSEEAVSYVGLAVRVTPFNYSVDGLTFYAAQELTVQAGDYVEVAIPLDNGSNGGLKNTYGPTEADPEVIGPDGAVKHVGFKVEYIDPVTARDARMDECLVVNGVAFDTSATFGTALVACTASDTLVYALDDTAPQATYASSSTFNGVSITCAWNKYTGAAYTAIGTAPRYASFTEGTLVTVSSTNGSYHANSLIIGPGTMYFTWPGGSPAAMNVWPGAIMQHSDGSAASPSPQSEVCTAVLSQQATGGTWHELGSWTIPRTYWMGDPSTKDIVGVQDITIAELKIRLTAMGVSYASDATRDTLLALYLGALSTNFKITFSGLTVIRGMTLVAAGAKQVFKDDNIASGSITGIQTKLQVGDNDMACRVMDLWQQRLVMASSTSLPFTMWFSSVGDIYNFYANRPQVDSDAFSVTIPATKASKILHLVSGKWLTIFTESGEYVCDSGPDGFSYRSVSIKQVSSVGIHPDVEPVQTEDRMVFVAHDGRSVYEMRYDLQQDSVIPIDRSILAYHLTEGATIIRAAYQRFPDSVVWFLLSDGTLLSMTFIPDQEVTAWARHTVEQPSGFSGTLKLVDIFAIGSVRAGTGVETTSDIILVYEVFSSSTRQAKTYVERMRPNVSQDAPAIENARCADHIGITNPPAVSAKLVTLRPESPDFNTAGLPKNILDVCIRIRRAHTIAIKPNDASLSALTKSAGSTGSTTATLFSGDVKIAPKGYINGDGQLEITSTNNMPCEILSMVANVEVQQ